MSHADWLLVNRDDPPRTLWLMEQFGPTEDGFAIPEFLLDVFLTNVKNKFHRFVTFPEITAEQATRLADSLAEVDASHFGFRLTLHLHDDPTAEVFGSFIAFLRGGAIIMKEG